MAREIPHMPKLKVKAIHEYPGEEIIDLEQAKRLPFLEAFVFIEGYRVTSYDELV